MTKAMKGIGVIKRLSKMLPQHSLLTIYKSFVRPHLDYGDIFYDQPNKSFCQKIETVQYNTQALAQCAGNSWHPRCHPCKSRKKRLRQAMKSLP